MALGAFALGLAMIFALLPGTPTACGSMLAPMFPPTLGGDCVAAQLTWSLATAGSVLLGLMALVTGVVLIPSRSHRSRRR